MWKQIWQQAHIQAHIHIVERVERIERNMIHNIFSSTYSYTSYCQYIFFIYSWIIWFVNSKINAVLNFVCQNKPRTNSPTSSTATASRPVQPTSTPSLRLGFLKKKEKNLFWFDLCLLFTCSTWLYTFFWAVVPTALCPHLYKYFHSTTQPKKNSKQNGFQAKHFF